MLKNNCSDLGRKSKQSETSVDDRSGYCVWSVLTSFMSSFHFSASSLLRPPQPPGLGIQGHWQLFVHHHHVVFCPILNPIPNFIQIGWKTQKLKIFAIGRFWLVGLVGQKMTVAISNSFYVVFSPILAPIPNFIQIAWKTQKLKFFAIGRFWLVGFGW